MHVSECAAFPYVASTDYSSLDQTAFYADTFDKIYIADSCTTPPDSSFAGFSGCNFCCGQTIPSIEVPSIGHVQRKTGVINDTLQVASSTAASMNTSFSPYNSPSPFGHLEHYPSDFSFQSIDPQPNTSVSPLSQQSRNSSPCSDALTPVVLLDTLELKQRLAFKRESSGKSLETDQKPTLKRKRGRPRRDHGNSYTQAECTKRVPHTEVERKYREGLNAKLESLRRAVPTLPQGEEGCGIGQPKPSKLMVIASAIEYIKKVERERDTYRSEKERLRSLEH